MSLYLNKAMFKSQIDKSFYYGLGFFGGLGLDFMTATSSKSQESNPPYDDIAKVFEEVLNNSSGLSFSAKKEIKDKLSPLGVELTDEGVEFLYNSYLDCLEPDLYNSFVE